MSIASEAGSTLATPLDRPFTDRLGKGFLALAGSIAAPGLGQALSGRASRGVKWFVLIMAFNVTAIGMMSLPALAPAGMALGVASVIVTLAGLVDAFLGGRRSQRAMLRRSWLRYAAGIALIAAFCIANPALLLARVARWQVVETFVISDEGSRAMAPTIEPDDQFLVHKRPGRALERWDIVVYDPPGLGGGTMRRVSRVVGLPGETVEIVGSQLHINGEPVNPPPGLKAVGPYEQPKRAYLLAGAPGNGAESHPLVLGADEYYLLGDRSAGANDSRYWRETAGEGRSAGALPRERIVGIATWTYWPLERWRDLRTRR